MTYRRQSENQIFIVNLSLYANIKHQFKKKYQEGVRFQRLMALVSQSKNVERAWNERKMF
jgi:hypothetical protein